MRVSSIARPATWDLFCRVVDNYGDVGIAWRLARQLADERRTLRLIVDGLDVLAKFEPRIDAATARQTVAGIDLVSWSAFDGEPADVVIELLGCRLPAVYLDAMEARGVASVWIDYEHLSAEAWVDDFHALPSPHPTRPLVKHFFYPGFGPRSGGLPIEVDVDARRRAFVDDASAVAAFRQTLGIPEADRYLSLFAYPDAPVGALFDALATGSRAWSVVVPAGVLTEPVAAWIAEHGSEVLRVTTIPFVAQDDYDRLLWSCDINCVRGEDSFVRAQLAARPFVWAAYRQPDDVHLQKLAAFDERHGADMPADLRVTHRCWSLAWNTRSEDRQAIVDAARAWLAAELGLRAYAEQWSLSLAQQEPLVDRLVAFAATLDGRL